MVKEIILLSCFLNLREKEIREWGKKRINEWHELSRILHQFLIFIRRYSCRTEGTHSLTPFLLFVWFVCVPKVRVRGKIA